MEQKSKNDPMDYWTKPRYKMQIERCLHCKKKKCYGNCTFSAGTVSVNPTAVARILHGWSMTIGEFSTEYGLPIDLVYTALRGEALAYDTVKRLAEALDTYPQELME